MSEYEIDLLVQDLQIGYMETSEILEYLRNLAITDYRCRRTEINQLLWDEKLDDIQGDKFHLENETKLCETIIDLHYWAESKNK